VEEEEVVTTEEQVVTTWKQVVTTEKQIVTTARAASSLGSRTCSWIYILIAGLLLHHGTAPRH